MPKFDTTVLEPAAAEIADRNPVLLGEATALSQAISLKRIADSLDRLTSATPALMSVLDINGPAAAAAAVKAAIATKTDDNPWIEWRGGECPVPDGTLVDVRYRWTGITDRARDPRELHWDDRRGGTIVAYRIHKDGSK